MVIEVADPSTSPHYDPRANETVASLNIPNELFLLWDKKIQLQKRMGSAASKLADMLNHHALRWVTMQLLFRVLDNPLRKGWLQFHKGEVAEFKQVQMHNTALGF